MSFISLLNAMVLVVLMAEPIVGYGSVTVPFPRIEGECNGVKDHSVCAKLIKISEGAACTMPDVGAEISQACKYWCQTCIPDTFVIDRTCNGVEDAMWCRARAVAETNTGGTQVINVYPCLVRDVQVDRNGQVFQLSEAQLNANPFLASTRADCPFRCKTCVKPTTPVPTPSPTPVPTPAPATCNGIEDPPKCGGLASLCFSTFQATIQADCPATCNTCVEDPDCAGPVGRKRARKCFDPGSECNGVPDAAECFDESFYQYCTYPAIPDLQASVRAKCPATCKVCPTPIE